MERSSAVEPRTLAAVEVLETSSLVDRLGLEGLREVATGFELRLARLIEDFGGLAIERARRSLVLFESPLDAVGFCLACHQAARGPGSRAGAALEVRAAVHLGEAAVWEASPEDVARGVPSRLVEGPARADLARVLSLATAGQTLLTRAAYDLARRAAVGEDGPVSHAAWREHGRYRFPGAETVLEIFEVGIEGAAPLSAPEPRAVDDRAEPLQAEAAWRPAAGAPVPDRPHWTLERRLDDAAFGKVWLGKHRKTGDPRAFRFADPRDRPRLERQLAVGRHVRLELDNPPFLVPSVDSHLDAEPYFLESEYLAARTLPEWAESRGGLPAIPLETRLELVAQLAEVLAALHSIGVVLSDVRPSLLLVREDGDRPALALTELSRARLTAASGVSIPGGAPGSPAPDPYRAPEVGAGEPSSPAGDLYALGVFLYQVVAGSLDRRPGPFWERDVSEGALRDEVKRLLEPIVSRRESDPLAVARRLRGAESAGDPEERAAASAPERPKPSRTRRWWPR